MLGRIGEKWSGPREAAAGSGAADGAANTAEAGKRKRQSSERFMEGKGGGGACGARQRGRGREPVARLERERVGWRGAAAATRWSGRWKKEQWAGRFLLRKSREPAPEEMYWSVAAAGGGPGGLQPSLGFVVATCFLLHRTPR